MPFNDEGFLSPDLAKWMPASTGTQLGFSSLSKRHNPAINSWLLPRSADGAVQSFEGAMLMTERGMIADAPSLMRSPAEAAIALWGVIIDEKFVDALIEAPQRG